MLRRGLHPLGAALLVLAVGCENVGGYGWNDEVLENENDRYHFAKIFIVEGRYEAARLELERASELRQGEDPEHDVDLAFCYMKLGEQAEGEERVDRYRRGIEAASRAAAKRPELAAPHAMAAFMHLGLDEVEDAIAESEQACALEPDSAAHHFNLGEAYARAGRREEAAAAFQRAAALDAGGVGEAAKARRRALLER